MQALIKDEGKFKSLVKDTSSKQRETIKSLAEDLLKLEGEKIDVVSEGTSNPPL